MNNQLIRKEDSSFWGKIKFFFRKLFRRDKNEEIAYTQDESQYIVNSTNFKESLKIETTENQNDRTIKEYAKIIETNPDAIDDLTEDMLDALIKYYEEIIETKTAKIKRLKISNA
ncbi:MAG: hypothetical protein IKP28_03025 [Clostridia bacterium]|nr:hypothetical protein [Clostridia bacterium]